MHEPVQQSVPAVHAVSGTPQSPATGAAQTLFAQFAVQHSALLAHAPSTGLHSGTSTRDPSRIASMNPSP